MLGQPGGNDSASRSTSTGSPPVVALNSTESAAAKPSSDSPVHDDGQQCVSREGIPKHSNQPGDTIGFNIGDTVLARTAGKPAREASIVEVAIDGSRFKVAFKDKRKKGGWRDKANLSSFVRKRASSVNTTSTALPASHQPETGAGAGAAGANAATVPSTVALAVSGKEEAETTTCVGPRPSLPKGGDKSVGDESTPTIRGKHKPTVNNADKLQVPTPEQHVENAIYQTQRTAPDVVIEKSREPIIYGTHERAVPHPPVVVEAGGFRIGDRVMVKATTTSSVLHEAMVVDVDISKRLTLFSLRFKDKRKKGVWKATSELIPAIHAPPSRQGVTFDASVDEAADKARSAPASSASDLRGEDADSNVAKHGSNAAEVPRAGEDNTQKSKTDNELGIDHAKLALDGDGRTGTGPSVDENGEKGSQRRAASKSAEETVGFRLGSKTGIPDGTGEQPRLRKQGEEPRFQVGAAIRIEGGRGRSAGRAATVVEVDASTTPHRFKVAFKDKRKKDSWKTTEELISVAAGDQTRGCEVRPPAPPRVSKTSAATNTTAVENSVLGELQHDKNTTTITAAKQPTTNTASPAQQTSSVDEAPCKGGRAGVGNGARAVGGGGGSAPAPKRKGKAKAKASEKVKAVPSTKTPRTPGKRWKRPNLVTSGTGEAESALRWARCCISQVVGAISYSELCFSS